MESISCSYGGGIDPREILNNGTPEVPPENIVAMFDAAAEFNGDSQG